MLGLDVYFLTIFITFFLSIFVFLILWISFSTNKSKMLKSNMVLTATCQKKLKENNFNITKTITLNDYFTIGADNIEKQKVFIDEENRKICFINYETHKYYILNFNELINYEVYSNDTSLSVGGHGGGLFAGLFAASSEKRIKELKLIIRINQIQNSQIV
ncbi:MAG: hypothetical protein J5689_02190, partial [Clostridia bacterium]|nr:hypothetical protein [Clostridia bacterium]